jgi:hypothetical protein
MGSHRIIYAPRSDTTPEAERSALANIYRLILDSAMKRGRNPDESGLGDAERSLSDGARPIIQHPK